MKTNIKQIKNVVACGLMFSCLSSCLTKDFEDTTGELGFTNESPFLPAPGVETPGREPSSDQKQSGVAPVVVASGAAPVVVASGAAPVKLASGQAPSQSAEKQSLAVAKSSSKHEAIAIEE